VLKDENGDRWIGAKLLMRFVARGGGDVRKKQICGEPFTIEVLNGDNFRTGLWQQERGGVTFL
jgi:hypothetical protein